MGVSFRPKPPGFVPADEAFVDIEHGVGGGAASLDSDLLFIYQFSWKRVFNQLAG